jgi:hypothetical protein
MKKIHFAPILLSVLFSGCAYNQPMGLSSASIGSQYERPSGMAEGRAKRWQFFPCYSLCPVGDDSLIAAVNNALDGKVGDTLANVYVERKTIAFPHKFFPLLERTEVVVMGTLVKYNTKEFTPDKDFVYSGNAGDMWAQMLSFNKGERMRYLKGLPDWNRSMLIEFALDKEAARRIETGSRDREVFALLLLREPKTYTPKAELRSEASVNLSECNSYDCIITLSPGKQAEALRLITQTDNKLIHLMLINSAKRRIKACYSNRTPSVVTTPEVQLIYNEADFLENLCKSGELNG